MLKSVSSILTLIVLSLAISGCQTKGSVVDGSGFVETKPKAATVNYFRQNDPEFGADTALNNRTCKRSPGCKKKGN